MAKVAKATPGVTIYTEGQTFDFGADGKRQVTEAEIEKLRKYKENGGPVSVEIVDDSTKRRG